MTDKKSDPELQFPLTAWQFWLIAFTATLYCIDTFVQALMFSSILDSLTSGLIFLLLGFEIYSRLKHKKTLFGKRYSLILSFGLILLLLFIYLL